MSKRPRYLSPVTNTSKGPECVAFIEAFCRATEDTVGAKAGELLVVRDWQKALVNALLCTENGIMRHRRALVGMPRKHGKTTLSAGIALWSLVLGAPGGQIYSIAGDTKQARLVFGTAKRMVLMDAELSKLLKVYQSSIVNESTGSAYHVRSADAGLAHGLNPTLVIYDEVHVARDRDLWDALDTARGAREESLLLGITTAGARTDSHGRDTLAYELFQYGQRIANGEMVDPSFFFAWWQPRDEAADWKDPSTWRDANPGYGDLLSEVDFATSVLSTPEATFRTLRLNQWVASRTSWLPSGAWDACRDGERDLQPGDCDVVFGFDGSRTNDSTALVLATVEKDPHIRVLGLWERPPGDVHWRVRDADVLPVLREAYELWRPVEIAADIAYWRDQLEDLADEGLPIVQITQASAGMTGSAQAFYEAVVNGHLSHDGDPRLARHIENTTVKNTPAGMRIAKESSSSNRKIDLSTSSIMAFRRAKDLAGDGSGCEPLVSLSSQVAQMSQETRKQLVDEARERISRLVNEEQTRIDALRKAAA